MGLKRMLCRFGRHDRQYVSKAYCLREGLHSFFPPWICLRCGETFQGIKIPPPPKMLPPKEKGSEMMQDNPEQLSGVELAALLTATADALRPEMLRSCSRTAELDELLWKITEEINRRLEHPEPPDSQNDSGKKSGGGDVRRNCRSCANWDLQSPYGNGDKAHHGCRVIPEKWSANHEGAAGTIVLVPGRRTYFSPDYSCSLWIVAEKYDYEA